MMQVRVTARLSKAELLRTGLVPGKTVEVSPEPVLPLIIKHKGDSEEVIPRDGFVWVKCPPVPKEIKGDLVRDAQGDIVRESAGYCLLAPHEYEAI